MRPNSSSPATPPRRRGRPVIAAAAGLALAATLAATFAAPPAARADDPDSLPQVHALTNARIVQGPGRVLESGTLVLRGGVIEAVGADVPVPDDAKVWDFTGATLYPGLVESFHTRDWPTPDADDEDAPALQGLHGNPIVHPERDMTFHAHDEGEAKELREAGFTSAVIVPEPGLLRGSSVLIATGDGTLHRNLLRRNVAQNIRLATAEDGYPNSLMGSVALLRQTLLDARWHADAQAAYAADPRQARPDYSVALESLGDLVAGEAPAVMESSSPDDALRLARLASEFDLDATLVGSGQEYRRLDALAATGLPFVLPVKFPKEPKVGEEDDFSLDLDTLRHWDRAPDNPRLLHEAGVSFALTSHGLPEPKKIHEMLAKAIERGYGADQALAALTTVPAERLGMADRLGTLDVGKLANVVVADGELFVEKTKIRAVFVDGHHYEIKESKPPSVDPLGTWAIVIDAGPGGQIPVTVTLTGTVEDLSGNIAAQGGLLPLAEAEVSDDTVNFSFDSTPMGMPGSISFAMKVDGDSCSGTGTAPQGDFTFTGDRTARPEGSDEPERTLGDLRALLQEGLR